MKRKIISIMLALAMCLSLLPAVSLPASAAEAPTGVTEGSGTKEDPYQISTAQQLQELSEQAKNGTDYTDTYFKMTANIDLSSVCGAGNANWTPIGTSSKPFNGTFDGDEHEITKLYISATNGSHHALFGYVGANGTVENLTVADSTVSYTDAYAMYTGAVAGQVTGGGKVYNCHSGAGTKVSGSQYVGGVVGYNDGTVENCSNAGTVSGSTYVGGVVGQNYTGGTVENCSNAGTVSGSQQVGGVVGCNYGSVEGCYNTQSINCNASQFGGVVGQVDSNGTVKNCYNTAAVTNSSTTGGVVGSVSAGTVTNCYNAGNVKGSNSNSVVGGVVGSSSVKITVENCYNTATVESPYLVGGVVGQISVSGTAEVKTSYNTGELKCTGTANSNNPIYTGGVVGYIVSRAADTITVENCYNTGTLPSTGTNFKSTGGVVGCISLGNASAATTIKNCFNTSYVSPNSVYTGTLVGCIIGDGSTNATIYASNCYYITFTYTVSGLSPTYTVPVGSAGGGKIDKSMLTETTAEKLASGEVACALRNVSQSDVWGQTLAADGKAGDPTPRLRIGDPGDFAPAVYQVTFDLNYNGAPAAQTQYVNPDMASVAAPTRDGYFFGGWYTDAGTSGEMVEAVDTDCTLYAKWTTDAPVTRTVTFLMNDGTAAEYMKSEVPDATAVPKPADPTRADSPNGAKYTFGGWYTDAACTAAYNFGDPVNQDLTLYAKWETVTYTVTFNWNYSGATEPFNTVTVDSGTAVAEPVPGPSRNGFIFAGWYTDAACGDSNEYNFADFVTNNLTLYAKWTEVQEEKVSISYYDPNNSSAGNAKEALILTSGSAGWEAGSVAGGWYAARGEVTIQGVTVSGSVNLILENGCNLTVTGGINIPSGSSLTIWGQNEDYAKDGVLTALGADSTTGNGGDAIGSIGALTINGGVITATGGSSSDPGSTLPDREGIVDNINDIIFGGAGICAGPLTTKGGIINATGGNGYGYGGFGITSKGDVSIEISGGEVTAKGGDTTGVRTGFKYWYGGHGLAFFDSTTNRGKQIIISGSKVTATGGTAVIESGSEFLTTAYYGEGGAGLGNCGAITITDSEVTAQGGNGTAWGGNGLGAYKVGTKGNITISNSTVSAIGGEQTLAYDNDEYSGGFGIDCINLVIDGGSEVTATGGNGRDGDSFGIRLYDSGSQYFTITDSTVTATAGAGSSAYSTADGIWLYTGEFTINSGTVTVNGGRYGINAPATTIKGGIVTAVGTVAAFSRKPDIASSYTHITTDPSEETAYEWTGASDETIWTEAALKIQPWTVQAPGFTVTASPATVAPGGTSALKAVLTFDLGSGKTPVKDVTADTAFTLTPEDGYDEQTKIDGATLTVGEGEEAETLTISATYPEGSGEYTGTATVTIGITDTPGSDDDEKEPAFSLVSLKVNSTGITLKAGGTMSQPAALAATVASSVTQFTITVQYEGSGVVKYGIAKDVLAETGAVLENGKPSEAIKINGNKTAIYLYAASTDAPDSGVYYELTVTKQSSGGGSGGGSTGGGGSTTTTTTTTTNPDGSITTTTTDKSTGTVTQTTKNTDGTTSTVETKTDGTVTTTEKAANGVEVRTVDQPGQSVTASVTIPSEVSSAIVTIPTTKMTPGTVAIDAATGELIMLSVPTEEGIAVKLNASRNIILMDNSIQFTDVSDVSHWAEDSISFVSSHRLFIGTSENTFDPESNTSRIQLMTVLARLDGVDTSGDALRKGMEWAVSAGISDGSNPDAAISRQQVAVMLWRYAGSPESSQALTAADAGDAADYARTALAWAVEVGILAGYPDGTLKPEGNASRAQVAAMVQRFCATMV